MKQLGEFLYERIPIFLFCVAVTLLFLHFKALSASYQCMSAWITENEVLYEASNFSDNQSFVKDMEKTPKRELMITLVAGLSYDIVVDGIFYEKDTFDYENFDFTHLADSYEKTYQYDKDGKIQVICYTKEAVKK